MNGTATTFSATATRCFAHIPLTTAVTRRWEPSGATPISRRSAVRRPGKTRRRVAPQNGPYKWWNWHDNYEAEPTPYPKWVDVITDPEGAARRSREEGAKAS